MQPSDPLGLAIRALDGLISDARDCFGSDLISVTLYGTAAEERLRDSSDVNVIFVFTTLDLAALERFVPKLAFARAATPIVVMLMKESEIPVAVEMFAQKFSDVHRRHKLLFGRDCFADAKPSRNATILCLRQMLLNLTLRMREAFADRAAQPERLSALLADFAGPLRACAATLRELKGQPILQPKEALEQFASEMGDAAWLVHLSEAREGSLLLSDIAIASVKALLATAEQMRAVVESLP